MPDNPPISTEVPETVTTDTGADKETVATLNDSFLDFWKEQDTKSEAPPAPGQDQSGAAQETKTRIAGTEEPKPEPIPVKPETVPVKPEAERKTKPKEFTDEEIDKLELRNARPELIEHVKQLKESWKADRARAKLEADRVRQLAAELEQARANSWTPEQKADYEHASQIRRRFDFVSDPEFIQKFHAPIQQQYEALLEEAVEALPDKNAARAWADYIKANYPPERLNRAWWLNDVTAKVPNEIERQSLLNGVGKLLNLQKERDTEVMRRTADKSSFDSWINEKVQTTSKRVQEEIMDEIGIQERRIQEVLPRNVDQAKTQEERRAIERHNERFERLNKYFKDTVQDLSLHGPRAWVRASVEATRSLILAEQLEAANEELESAQTERDRYKAELDKITGARRKLAASSATSPAAAAAAAKTKGEGLSLKDLDVRKSFDRFDWGDTT
jgi:hypothetical protein